MSVFHGNWDEDPKEFLDSYIQCTATGNDNFKCRQFINYLGAGSDADDWFKGYAPANADTQPGEGGGLETSYTNKISLVV